MKFFFMHVAKTAGSAINEALSREYGDRFIDHIETKRDWLSKLDHNVGFSGHFYYPTFRRLTAGKSFKYVTVLRDPVSRLRSALNWSRVLGQNPNLRQHAPKNAQELSDKLSGVDFGDPQSIRSFIVSDTNDPLRMALFDNGQARYFVEGPSRLKFTARHFCDAADALQQFDFIGFNEDIPGAVAGLKKTLGITGGDFNIKHSNVQAYDKSIDRVKFIEALDEWIGYDCALYELARAKFAARPPAASDA